ncbi:MAG: formylglycine-generating enzyme family protein [Thermodesulfobacteriota bacterium]
MVKKNFWSIWNLIDGPPFPPKIICPIDRAEMVLIPAGEFIMGISEAELQQVFSLEGNQNPVFATETPARKVMLEDYYIDVHPVTNYQYGRFLKETGHRPPLLWRVEGWNDPLQPVVGVGWNDARAYAAWAGKELPTEAQWEKAARGTDGRWWPWGNDFYPGYCNSAELGVNRTTEVTRFHLGLSPYGCYDMAGNVWEMCEGEWLEGHLPMRGGCFLGNATFVRTTVRWSAEDEVNGAYWLGFRCVKNLNRG